MLQTDRYFSFNRIILGVIATLLPLGSSWAATNLKKVQISNGSQIDLIFDGKVESGQIKTEFVRDNIQLSLQDVSVYPAKVSMVSGMDLTKVFAYQYAPKIVRARFTVKGDAEKYQNRLQVKSNGKVVTVRILPAKQDQVSTTSASADRVVKDVEKGTQEEPVIKSKKELSSDEKVLLDRVSNEKPSGETSKKTPLAGGKPLPSPMRSIGVMLFIVGLLGVFLMFMKRLKGGSAKGMSGLLGKISGNLTHKNKIEVISTHHLGPKKSIVMVKIQNRMLVLGMTNDSVNLITEFKANENEEILDEDEIADSLDVSDFAEGLKKFESAGSVSGPKFSIGSGTSKNTSKSKSALGELAAAALGMKKPSAPTAANRAVTSAYATAGAKTPVGAQESAVPAFAEVIKQESTKTNIRAQVKSRMEGMKQL